MDHRAMYFNSNLKTRDVEDNGDKYIEGYFAVFNQETELCRGVYEELAPTAFDNSLKNNDIRCLFNHDTSLVLGRMANNTLQLRTDPKGLFGSVKINSNDKQAMDIYARVQRGDISGCSFGFNPAEEDTQYRDDGSVKFRVKDADTIEVSVCVFPAYPQTDIQARSKQAEQYKQRQLEVRKKKLLERVKNYGNKTIDDK